MSQLLARCIEQVLMFENTPEISSGNVNYDSVKFDFCSSWTGFTKTAIFYRNEDEVYYQLLDEANTCIIPKEVLAERGVIHIGVFGVYGDKLLTSQVLSYRISQGAITENIKPADPTPDIYAQVISRYDAIIKELERQFKKLEDLQSQFDGAVGNADTLDGHDSDYFATAESVSNVVNGTTKVRKASEADNAGNANTLGGHEAEYFGKSSEVTSEDGGRRNQDTDIADYRQKMVFIGLKEGSAINLPVCSYSYVFGLQGWSDQSGGLAHELAFNDMGIYRRRVYDDNTKTNWTRISDSDDLANYLPLNGGGRVEGPGATPLIIRSWSSSVYLDFENVTEERVGAIGFMEKNKPIFVNDAYDRVYPLLHTGNMADYVLPLTGGTIEANTTVPIGVKVSANGVGAWFKFANNDGSLGHYGFKADGTPTIIMKDDLTEQTLHHDGNSAKVHIGTSAPSDTSALWIDTSA